MLPPTFAPCILTFAPYILTFGPCACGVSLLLTGANIPLAQVVVDTSCNLRSWCFFIQPLAQIVHLHMWWHHPLQLALVVLFHPSTGANTALAPGQLALCGGLYSASCNLHHYTVQVQFTTTTTDHHHTVQVARVQVQYLRQWLDEKAPPAQVAEGDTTTCASGLSALVAE